MRKLFFALILLAAVSCKNTPKQATQISEQSKDSNEVFFPVTSYLKGQLYELDSMPFTPLYIVTENGHTDSIWLKLENQRPYLETFLTPLIDSVNLIGLFKETNFNDLSMNSITFTYEPDVPLPDSMQLQNWNVYVDPEKGIVTKVYMLKKIKENNKESLQQLTWKSGKWAKINTLQIKDNGETELVKEEKIVWDLDE